MTRRRPLIALAAAAALGLAILAGTAAATPETVTLCHAAGQSGTTKFVTLTIPYNAAFGQAGHFGEDGTPNAGHEDDYLGPCTPEVSTTVIVTTTEPEVTTTAPTTTVPPSTTVLPSTTVPEPTTTVPPSPTTTAPPVDPPDTTPPGAPAAPVPAPPDFAG